MKTMHIIIVLSFGLLAVCCANEAESVDLDRKAYNLTSEEAQIFLGSASIPRRAQGFGMLPGEYPRPTFATVGDWEVRSRLEQGLGAMLGIVPDDSEISVDGGELSAKYDTGFAAIAEGTGTHVVKRLGVPRGATVVEDAEQAVNLALEAVAEAGLISLATHESLDVVGIASTHYAGWFENGGELEPVHFEDPHSGALVTQYKSDYTVYFGRRYRGVPILGPTLAVRLDADGEMAAFMKGWRDISGETAPVTILAGDEVTTAASAAAEAADDALTLKNAVCGFTEGTDPAQAAAGIGCSVVYENAKAIGTLAETKTEWVSLAEDPSIELGVEQVVAAEAEAATTFE